MPDARFQPLPGFRDFAPQECAFRNYLFNTWRRVAHRYGFVEWEAPTIEATDLYLKKSGGELNALMRTTVAFTQMHGSKAPNVIPPEARMVANMRLNPADSVESALDYLRKVVDDDAVEITALESFEPSRISTTDCEGWEKVSAAVAETWRGCLVAPYLMVQCSDSRHYGRISDKVYRFCAMALSNEERASIHGHNERIPLETIHKTVEFYIRLLQKC